MAAEDARIYRIRAEFRRCGIYVLVGAIVCFCVAITVTPLVKQFARPKADPGEMMVIMGLAVVAAAVFCLVLRQWCLRVDREGIALRRLWRWYVWPWEAFRSGKIKQDRVLRAYIWPEARWTYRKLLLDMIEESDAKEVDALIKRLWIAPPEGELPEEVTFRVLRTKVRLRADGIDVRRGRTERLYAWKDVERIVIERLERDRRDFVRLRIDLPEKPVEAFVHQGNPNWRGADAETIARWFIRHAPAGRVLTVASSGPPQTRTEAEYRLNDLGRDTHKCRIRMRWVVGIYLAPFLPALFRPMLLIPAVGYGLLGFAHWRILDRHLKRSEAQERELTEWLASQADQVAD